MTADLPDVDLTSASAFVAASGFVVTEVGGKRVAGHVDLGPDQHTPWGVVHGGVYCTAATGSWWLAVRCACRTSHCRAPR
jgi:acyl-coenzyme A thioesterase PaaI-like protein